MLTLVSSYSCALYFVQNYYRKKKTKAKQKTELSMQCKKKIITIAT